MKAHNVTASQSCVALALVLALAGCSADRTSPDAAKAFVVGVTTYDPNLPPEPRLPTADALCATLEASNRYVTRPDGALPPEADPSPSGVGVAATAAVVNPDQARIQAALDACGASVDAEVGATIAAADAIAATQQRAAAVPNVNIAGASGEELARPQYRAKKYAVRLTVNENGPGNAFITGPLTLPSGVTLWIDKGVTLFATRDVIPFRNGARYCANTAVSATSAGSSSNCLGLINGNNLVNSAIVGDGSIDGRGYAEIVTTNRFYPLMKVDLTCSNTYAAFSATPPTIAPDGTPCDNGGTVVDSRSSARNMTWWDLAFLGNMVNSGRTGYSAQSVHRMMVFNYAKNLTLYRIRMHNSANFHFVPAGVDGLTVWGVKLQTPSRAAYANPSGNGNPLYTGALFTKDNVKNTDAFDPASAPAARSAAPTTGSTTSSSAGPISFDGYLKNVVFAYNFVSTGDDDIVLKGSNNPSPRDAAGKAYFPGVDGGRDVRSDRTWGIVIAHNHIYWGHGISIGSETNAGVTNVHVYDNSFIDSEEALRIKSDYARGGEVSNISYENICIKGALNALLFTPYYSTRALPVSGGVATPLYPNFHDIALSNVRIIGESNVRLEGLAADTGGYGNPQYPLGMGLAHVVADDPDAIKVISSDANLDLNGVNLPIFASEEQRVNLVGLATRALDPERAVDCSKAFVDFPTDTNLDGATW